MEFSPALSEPEATIRVKLAKNGVIHVMEYCNLHGLWSNKKEIKVG
jgi:superoxide reductase